MRDWNVVATVREQGFVRACELLEELGPVARTHYYNVVVMKVGDVDGFMEDLRRLVEDFPRALKDIGRVAPARVAFDFATVAEFESRAREAVLAWAPEVSGRGFHVRLHRRGFKGRLGRQTEEQFLDEALLEETKGHQPPAWIAFDDPEVVIHVETIDGRAGLALWTRADIERYPFLPVD